MSTAGARTKRPKEGLTMTISRMRGLFVAALLATCAALPAAAEAATVSTTTSCLDVNATTDQFVDFSAAGLKPADSYYTYLSLNGDYEDSGIEIGSLTGELVIDAAGNG